jgi:serine/threonine protein kinase
MVKFKGYTYLPANKAIRIPKNYHVFVLELLDTTLEALLKSQYELFTPMFIRHVAHGIATGMQQVHFYNVLHRDLKSANILMKKVRSVQRLLFTH